MMVEKRTLREWFAYLDSVERELTLTELMAVMLFNQREYQRLQLEMVATLKNAVEHTESMLGALDVLASNLAAMNGLPYAESHEIRAALDAARDAHRTLAAATRETSP